MTKKFFIIFCIFLFCSGFACAEETSVAKTLLWSLIIPGGGHFYLGQENAGNAYLLAEGIFLVAGLSNEPALSPGELNFFYTNALKIHELNIFTSYRQARIFTNNQGYSSPIDNTPLSKLMLAPFSWENISSPYVYGFFLCGILVNAAEGYLNTQRKSYENVSGFKISGAEFDRDAGSGFYYGMSTALSYTAGLSEECAYRGFVQAEFEESFGKTAGLYVSSGLFGAAHITDFSNGRSWANAGFASLAGFYLGWLFQKEGYKLSKPIAAHFWFDVAAFTTLFLIDPENNPLGIKVSFAF